MKKPLLVLCLLFSTLLGGCYAKGLTHTQAPSPPENSSMGTMFFYREPGYYGSWVPLTISLDGKKVVSIGQDGYTWTQVSPGPHKIGTSWGVELNTLVTGGKQYFRLHTYPVAGGNQVVIKRVPENEALEQIREYKYVPARQ